MMAFAWELSGNMKANETANGGGRPEAFISSFYREIEGYSSYRDSPLWLTTNRESDCHDRATEEKQRFQA